MTHNVETPAPAAAPEPHPIRQVHDYLDGKLPDASRDAYDQHLNGCEGCRNYTNQLRQTLEVLQKSRRDEPISAGPQTGAGDQEAAEFRQVNDRLLALARAIDRSHAEDVVQTAWASVLTDEGRPRAEALVDLVVDLAAEHVDDDGRVQSSAEVADVRGKEDPFDLLLDPDADAAELFLPDLYEENDDGTGVWVTNPVSWPDQPPLFEPEEFEQTGELFSVVEQVLEDLPDDLADLLTAVDIQGYDSDLIASGSGRTEREVRRDLAVAREFVRAKLNEYLAAE